MSESILKKSFKSSVKNNISLTVYNSGYEKCRGGHSWGPAVRDHYLIHYIVSGKGMYRVGGKEYHLSAGDMFLARESEVIYYCADEEDPWEYCWVGFNGTDAKYLLNMTSFAGDNLVIKITESEAILSLISNIYNGQGGDVAHETEMLGYLYLFLAKLMQMNEEESAVERGGYKYVRAALNFIKYNYSAPIDVSDIAKAVGVSRSHLYRVFMMQLSISPSDYLEKYRINEAAALLKNTELSVSEVANSVGFDDALYFSRVFKKNKGVPPSKHR